MPRRSTLLSAVAVCIAPALAAQDLGEMCRNLKIPPVGAWATYKSTGGHLDGETTRMAIIGSERRGDSTFHWFEVKEEGGKKANGPGIYQMLVGGTIAQPSIHGAVVKEGPKPAMRVPDAMIEMFSSRLPQATGSSLEKSCREATSLGTETVQVPAGSFRAVHFRGKDGSEGWASQQIPFGLVKLVQKGGTTMVLTGTGTGAKSSITETPQTMSFPGMPTQ